MDLKNCSIQELREGGDLLAQTGFAGIKAPAAGFVILLTCQQEGISLLQFQQRYHFQQGRFSMQAHYLLSEFVARGGRYRLIERSPERAAIELEKDGQKYQSSLAWTDAQQEAFVYEGGEKEVQNLLQNHPEKLTVKAKYRTPRSRQQMLWARVISDGVATLDPGARAAYTTEEVADILDAEAPEKPAARPPEPVAVAMDAALVDALQPAAMQTPGAASSGSPLVDAARQQKAALQQAEADPKRCPVAPGGMTELLNMPWEKMQTSYLTSALAAAEKGQYPSITAAHQAEIRKVLNGRVDYAEGKAS